MAGAAVIRLYNEGDEVDALSSLRIDACPSVRRKATVGFAAMNTASHSTSAAPMC